MKTQTRKKSGSETVPIHIKKEHLQFLKDRKKEREEGFSKKYLLYSFCFSQILGLIIGLISVGIYILSFENPSEPTFNLLFTGLIFGSVSSFFIWMLYLIFEFIIIQFTTYSIEIKNPEELV